MNHKSFNLQVPVNIEIKQKASEEAKKQGFKSLQDATRFLITKLANKQINIGIIQQEVEYVSEKEEERLDAINSTILDDLKKGRATIVNNGTDLINKLHKTNNSI